MEAKKRLIDANALPVTTLTDGGYWTKDVVYKRDIDEAPTVDAVEVVRCMACKKWCRNAGIVDSPNGHCFCHDIDTNQFDFCSYGERRAE